jgi:hypothetical protein
MHDIQTLVETCNAILLEEIEAYEGLLGIQQAEKQLLGARQLDAFRRICTLRNRPCIPSPTWKNDDRPRLMRWCLY